MQKAITVSPWLRDVLNPNIKGDKATILFVSPEDAQTLMPFEVAERLGARVKQVDNVGILQDTCKLVYSQVCCLHIFCANAKER